MLLVVHYRVMMHLKNLKNTQKQELFLANSYAYYFMLSKLAICTKTWYTQTIIIVNGIFLMN